MTNIFYQLPKGNSKFNSLSCVARIVYMILYDLIKQSKNNNSNKYFSENKKDYFCCYDSNKLAEFTCTSQPTVLKAIKELEKNSFIKIEKNKGSGNKYYVNEIYSDERTQSDKIRDEFTEKLDDKITSFFKNPNIPEKVKYRFNKNPMCYIDKIKTLVDEIKHKNFVILNGGSDNFVSSYLDWLCTTNYIKSFGANTLNIDSKPFKNFCSKYTTNEIDFKSEIKNEEIISKQESEIEPCENFKGLEVKLSEIECEKLNEIIKQHPDDKESIIQRLNQFETVYGISLCYDLELDDVIL